MLRWEPEKEGSGWRGFFGEHQVAIAYYHYGQAHWQVQMFGLTKHGCSPTFEQAWIDAGDVLSSILASANLAYLPDGYQIVPKEPTDEMLRAAHTAVDDAALRNYGGQASADDIYTAMLAAANKRGDSHYAPGRDAAGPVSIQFHQNDWIPGFGAYLAPEEVFKSPAHVELNIGSALCAVANGELPKEDVWLLLMETILHETGHAIEQWCKLEFSEERVDMLVDRYTQALEAAPQDGREGDE